MHCKLPMIVSYVANNNVESHSSNLTNITLNKLRYHNNIGKYLQFLLCKMKERHYIYIHTVLMLTINNGKTNHLRLKNILSHRKSLPQNCMRQTKLFILSNTILLQVTQAFVLSIIAPKEKLCLQHFLNNPIN